MATFKSGDIVRIRTQWRDPGDEEIDWVCLEDESGSRVLIEAQLPMRIKPAQRVRTDMIEHRHRTTDSSSPDDSPQDIRWSPEEAERIANAIKVNVTDLNDNRITWPEFRQRNHALWDEVAQGETNYIGSDCAKRHHDVTRLLLKDSAVLGPYIN
ncbi:MAG: hypothetical protein K9N51_08935 [Candidatus Pacebacteria bacterium]|nr:hypothetical protein [Candidatus Paceibacterota bacterium]